MRKIQVNLDEIQDEEYSLMYDNNSVSFVVLKAIFASKSCFIKIDSNISDNLFSVFILSSQITKFNIDIPFLFTLIWKKYTFVRKNIFL